MSISMFHSLLFLPGKRLCRRCVWDISSLPPYLFSFSPDNNFQIDRDSAIVGDSTGVIVIVVDRILLSEGRREFGGVI